VPLRVLIVDDSDLFLEAARVLLEREGLTVAGVASTSAEARRQVQSLQPQVVLVDIALGNENGFELALSLVEDGLGDDAAVILISTRSAEDFADLIAASPAAGFLTKGKLSANAIRRIIDGHAR
jgi:two-component system, NarL family, nitrate/nitrite response regulator NarL